MKLRKNPKPGQCHAQRCNENVNAPDTLCAKHRNEPVQGELPGTAIVEVGPEVDSLASTRSELLSLLDTAANIPFDALCETEAGQVSGLQLLGQLREYARQNKRELDEQRAAQKAPFLAGGREVDARYKPALDTAEALLKACDKRITEHARLQDEQRRAALAEVTRLAQENAPAAAIQVAHERAVAATPELPPQVKLRTVFRYEVVNHEDIPREFLTLDHSKLMAHINATQGTAHIPGVNIIREEKPVTA